MLLKWTTIKVETELKKQSIRVLTGASTGNIIVVALVSKDVTFDTFVQDVTSNGCGEFVLGLTTALNDESSSSVSKNDLKRVMLPTHLESAFYTYRGSICIR